MSRVACLRRDLGEHRGHGGCREYGRSQQGAHAGSVVDAAGLNESVEQGRRLVGRQAAASAHISVKLDDLAPVFRAAKGDWGQCRQHRHLLLREERRHELLEVMAQGNVDVQRRIRWHDALRGRELPGRGLRVL